MRIGIAIASWTTSRTSCWANCELMTQWGLGYIHIHLHICMLRERFKTPRYHRLIFNVGLRPVVYQSPHLIGSLGELMTQWGITTVRTKHRPGALC